MTAPHRAARRRSSDPGPDPDPDSDPDPEPGHDPATSGASSSGASSSGADGAREAGIPWTEAFHALEDHCRRAPSRHNTQPWTLVYERDRITIHWQPERLLPCTDPDRRDLFLSLGAFLETCLIVASGAGLAVRAAVDLDEGKHRAARLLPADSRYRTPFTLTTVETRGCARGQHRPGPLTGTELSAARDQLAPLPFARLVHLHTREIAALARRADRRLLADRRAAAELRSWLRPTARHPRHALDGLSGPALELTPAGATVLAACLTSPLHPLLRTLALPRLLAAAHHRPLRADGSVLVLVGDASGRRGPDAATPQGLIEHGRALARAWYALTEHGVRVHPLAALIDDPRTGPLLAARLGIGEERRILCVFRAGHAMQQPERSARIPAGGAVMGEGGPARR
ncbi:hypothetical protein [Peterkaempfera sp. SMS 1(5)a]|uniref:hypothetical protein n=1 Tax=Peterkaempfera podocarpi TaxID=3232308 RepID=UPI00366CC43F